MIRRMSVMILLLGTASTAHAAGNDCRVDAPDFQPDVVTASYDPFDAAPVSQEFQIEVRTQDCPSNRNLVLTVDSPDPNNYDGRVIRLTNGSGEALLAQLSDRSSSQGGRANDRFNVKQGLTALYLQIERGQVVRPGLYRASMRAFAAPNQGESTRQIGQPFNLVVKVEPAVGLAAGSGSELNLGELTDQARAPSNITFAAYANVGYQLSLSSDNDFQLRRQGEGAGIAYRPIIDDNVVSAGQTHLDYSSPSGKQNRRNHRLNVVVPTVGDATAGRYRDYLTVTIKPKFGD